jgi:carbon storage regulator
MLILTRKAGEAVLIGEHIRLAVVAIRGSQVRLAITAPRTVPIRRAELSCLPNSCDEPDLAPNARASEGARLGED